MQEKSDNIKVRLVNDGYRKNSVEKVIKSLQNVWGDMNESQPFDWFA